MKGDKIVIEEGHKKAGKNVYPIIKDEIKKDKLYIITVAGESGSGKSEIATVISNKLEENGFRTLILQQDDYFRYPPKTNHKMRKKDFSIIGPQEVRLSLIEENIESLKKGRIFEKPIMIYDKDRETTETVEPNNIKVVIVEGTYTTLIKTANKKIFIDKSYADTKKFREKRARETKDAEFLEKIVQKEHEIIKQHKKLADIVLDKEYNIISK